MVIRLTTVATDRHGGICQTEMIKVPNLQLLAAEGLLATVNSSLTANIERGNKTAREFLSAVKAIPDREAALRKSGSSFRIAEYSVDKREVRLNQIIGDLLKPSGSHGQRSRLHNR